MVVLIAPEQDILNELEILNELFQAGLEYYHLRKPHKSFEAHCNYLDTIDKKYHDRVVVHNYHELVNNYNLKGIHFQEAKRRALEHCNEKRLKDNMKVYLENFSTSNIKLLTISSSFHEPEAVDACDYDFDYHLLSPVFSSISKKGYEGKGFDINHINKKIIGMGGVNRENSTKFVNLGYKGIGVLGGVWNSSDPVYNFKAIKNQFNKQ